MIQRSLLRSSQAIPAFARAPPTSFYQQTPYIRSQLLRRQPTRIAAMPVARWYSEATGTKKEEESKETSAQTGGEAKSEGDGLQKELEAKNKEIVQLKDQYLRSVADYRNLQDRTAREIRAAKDFALQKFAKDLIDSVDNFDRALSNTPPEALQNADADGANKDLINLHSGLKMTETILMNTLKKHGLERFDPSDTKEKFDPNLHEATFMTPQPDKEDGTVFFTQQKGFSLNGRVLRAAKVGVVKNS